MGSTKECNHKSDIVLNFTEFQIEMSHTSNFLTIVFIFDNTLFHTVTL